MTPERKYMSLKYQCLVLDHDDTVVNSTATVHYPCFQEYTGKFFPHIHLTLEEYFRYNFHPGVIPLFTEICGMTWEQMLDEENYWKEYVKHHVPKAYPGIREILEEQHRRGGLIAVVSHSFSEYIRRDYAQNGLPEPDIIFGWECPAEERKPSPFPLKEIMRRYALKPEQLLVVDDLKPGYDMAKAVDVPFAAAGWANDIEEIETFMRKNSDFYFKKVEELKRFLFEE